MSTRIYHNPRCSKSRTTLELLHERKVDTDIIEYLKNPPGKRELEQLLELLKLEPRQLMRTGENEYTALGLGDESLSRDALIEAMIAHPQLIERPIVVHNGKAAIGRPPEKVLDIL